MAQLIDERREPSDDGREGDQDRDDHASELSTSQPAASRSRPLLSLARDAFAKAGQGRSISRLARRGDAIDFRRLRVEA
jgi:hypothetical protein